ncbi:MAG: permease [Kiritimatiellae bacterium]|nr:permease [Kiritimatiellia bacterium]
MLKILFNTLLESAPYIVLGFLIAGAVKVWVPQLTLKRHLAGSGLGPLLKSVGVGCLLPICSCGSIPLGMGLYRCGAATGNVLAFMTAAPVLSPVLILLSLRLLGEKITLTLLAAALVTSFVIGLLGNRFFGVGSKADLDNANLACLDCQCQDATGFWSQLKECVRWALFDLGAEVSIDIVLGLGLASLLLAFLPLEWISTWLGQQQLSTLLYVIILGVPVYACSIPSIPVVQGLLLMGATPGAAVAYLIAGPATNLGELNAIRRGIGWKTAVYYALMLMIMALAAGVVTDQLVFPDYQYHAYRQQGDLVIKQCCVPLLFGDTTGSQIVGNITSPVWHWPFGGVLLLVIGYGVCKKLKYFFINPCLACTRIEFMEGRCGGKCHVRRKYEMLHWVLKKRDFLRDRH